MAENKNNQTGTMRIQDRLNPGLKDLKAVASQQSQTNPSSAKLTGSFNAGLKDLKAVASQQSQTSSKN